MGWRGEKLMRLRSVFSSAVPDATKPPKGATSMQPSRTSTETRLRVADRTVGCHGMGIGRAPHDKS
jgi:hypothetical protein